MKNRLFSNRFVVNQGIMSWYVKQLKKLTASMTDECYKAIVKIYKSNYEQIVIDSYAMDDSISSQIRIALNFLQDKYYSKFSKKAKILIKSLIKKTDKYSNFQIKTAIKSMLGDNAKNFSMAGSLITTQKEEVAKALIFENVSLIRSIQSEYFKQITGSVARSIENGEGIKGLIEDLKSYGAKSKRRAELIAQDQTRKAYTSINLRNFQENNIQQAQWLHSGGSRDPREYHQRKWDGVSGLDGNPPNGLNGYIFDISKGAPTEDGKRFIYPGQEPYCRCIMRAILSFDNDSYSTDCAIDKAPKNWFTSNGAHIPIENGENKKEAFKEFKEEKQEEQQEKQYKPSQRYNRVKNRPRKPVQLPKEDMGIIHHNIETFGFNDFEMKKGVANRFSANYGVKLQIKNPDRGAEDYVIIRKWRLK